MFRLPALFPSKFSHFSRNIATSSCKNQQTYKVGMLDKWSLVKSGQYKSKNEVPNMVDANKVQLARKWMKGKMNLFAVCVLAGTALGGIYYYQYEAQQGKSPTEIIGGEKTEKMKKDIKEGLYYGKDKEEKEKDKKK